MAAVSSERSAKSQSQNRRNEGAEILVSGVREDLLRRTFFGDLPFVKEDKLLRQPSLLAGVLA